MFMVRGPRRAPLPGTNVHVGSWLGGRGAFSFMGIETGDTQTETSPARKTRPRRILVRIPRMSSPSLPEPWLRGSIEGVPAVLQPAAHALQATSEDVAAIGATLTADELWMRPGGAASLGFHLQHIVGATDRLLTYARGAQLNDAQKAAAKAEGTPGHLGDTPGALIAAVQQSMASAIDVLRRTPPDTVMQTRGVGRAALPTTVLGLLFHAAEHSQRHAGQFTTTAKIVRGERSPG
jgi:DinB superfamily